MALRTHVSGEMDSDTSDAALDELLAELEDTDAEHSEVSVKHETEWCLSVSGTGRIVWESVEQGEPRHIEGATRPEARRLLGLVARGELTEVDRLDWRPGYRG